MLPRERCEHDRRLSPDLPWPPNVWMGVSVENDDVAHRVDELRQVPAAVRFLSADRSRVVEDTFQEMYSHTVQKSVSVTNGAGWHAGRAAADRADLSIDRRAVSA